MQVAKEALQAACREVGVCDVSDLQPALQKLTAVVEAVPRLERLLEAAVGVVAATQTRRAVRAEAAALQVTSTASGRIRISRRQAGHGDAAASLFVGAGGDVDDLLPALQQWAAELARLADLEDFAGNMRALLGSRGARAALAGLAPAAEAAPTFSSSSLSSPSPSSSSSSSSSAALPPPPPPPSPPPPLELRDMLAAVEALLGARAAALREGDQRAAADVLVHAERPDAALSALVAHLQGLLAVPRVDGLLPCLNALRVRDQAAASFVATCRELLGGKFAPRLHPRSTEGGRGMPVLSTRGGVLVALTEVDGEADGLAGGDGDEEGQRAASDGAVLTEVARRLALCRDSPINDSPVNGGQMVS